MRVESAVAVPEDFKRVSGLYGVGVVELYETNSGRHASISVYNVGKNGIGTTTDSFRFSDQLLLTFEAGVEQTYKTEKLY